LQLSSARSKYRQAARHRDTFLAEGLAWLSRATQSGPAPIGKRTEPWGDGEVITYSIAPFHFEPPTELALTLGDALANYRATLDHAAWALVNHFGGTPDRPKQVYFPLADTKEQFARESPRKLPGLPAAALAIIQQYQPFQHQTQHAQHPLHALEQLVQFDKHRTLHVIAAMSTELKIDIPADYENFDVERQERRGSVGAMLPGTDVFRVYGRRKNPTRNHGVEVRVHGMRLTLSRPTGEPYEQILNRIDGVIGGLLTDLERIL
jgi:hypothetical protein